MLTSFLSWSIFKLVRLFNIRDVLLEDGVERIFKHVWNYPRESTEKKTVGFSIVAKLRQMRGL